MARQQASYLPVSVSVSVAPALGLQECAITLMDYAVSSMGYHMGSVHRPQDLRAKQQAPYLLNHISSREY